MRPKKLFIVLILISLVLLPVTPASADEATVSDIAKELICQCGCDMVLSACNHLVCDWRDTMLASIEDQIAQGKSKEQIIQSFVDLYGEQVLASPPKKGFNLVVWILPFAAILGGGVVIYLTVKAWVRRGRQSATISKAEKGDEKYRKRLEKELEDFSGDGFR